MLDYKILASKPNIQIPSKADDSEYVICKDLCVSSLNGAAKITEYKLVTVTNEYIARPDLVSLAMYGTDEYADIICKVNNISNPFELNAGMELIIPNFGNISNVFKRPIKSATIKDNNLISNIKKTNQKPKNSSRNPSEQLIGDTTFVVDKTNKIVYY